MSFRFARSSPQRPPTAAPMAWLEDPFAPLPVPEVLEDDSDAAWERWMEEARKLDAQHAATERAPLGGA